MDQLRNSHLTEDQEKAIASFRERGQNRYFINTTPELIAEDFLDANRMKQSTDPDEAARGTRYEQALFEQCGINPAPT